MKYEMIKLKELCIVNQGLQIPISKRYKEPGENRFFYITVQFLKDNGENYYIENPPKSVTCTENEILVVRTGNTGQVITGVAGCFHNNFFKVTPNEKVFPKYLYYALNNKKMHDAMLNAASGTTIPDLKHSSFYDLEIPLPELSVQKKIAKILDNICDKLKLNNEINNNLYKLSNEIHKNWMNERKDRETTDFINIKEFGKILMGQSPKGESYNYEFEGLPLINGAADYENGYLKAQKYTTKPKKVAHYGDLVFCIRATIGLLVVSDNDYCLGRGVASISNINELYKEYAFHIINNSIDEFKRMATGSVILGISREDIEKIKVIVPTEEEINKYHQIQKPLLDKMGIIRKENQVLINLRDTLLPRLINGEIDLDNIEI